MMTRTTIHRLVLALTGALAIFAFAAPVAAQTAPALPTAPGATRDADNPTAARASLPGENGSPLEPYLFLFILAGGGIVGVAFAVATDRRIRATAGNIQLQRRPW